MITSSQNPKIQYIHSLLTQKKAREAAGEFVVEGVRLLEEAILSGWKPNLLLFSNNLSERGMQLIHQAEKTGTLIEEIPFDLMRKISETDTPQGVLASFNQRQLPLPEKLDFVLIVDELRDPGNLGTLLRTAGATGVQAVFLPPGTVDAFSPKVVRAGMGAHFRIPVFPMHWEDIRNLLTEKQNPPLKILLAEASGGTSIWKSDFSQPIAILIGGEAFGASPIARQAVDALIHIPMPGKSESLNASVAASIILFEVVRQRTA